MDTKLTLTIEQSIIERAKEYAKDQGRSLSDLVENYLKLSVSGAYPVQKEIPDVVQELKGSFQAPDDFDYKKVLQEEIIKKHL